MISLNKKKRVYNNVFGNELGKEVLTDLRRFCHATQTTVSLDKNGAIDPLEMARREGRREVFMQIINIMQVDYEDIYNYEVDYDDE